MPVQKPSPHRFIAPNQPSTQTPKANPKSNLRYAISAHTPKPSSELQFKKITPAKRFVAAPTQRPHAGDVTPRAPDRVEEPESSASTDHTPRPKTQRKFERVESIEEASQSSPSRPLDDDAVDIVQTIEHERMFAEDEGGEHREAAKNDDDDDDDDEILFPSAPHPKRRRTSPPSPPSPTLPHQALPETSFPGAASHRFRFPPPQAPIPFNNLDVLAHTTTTNPTTVPAPPSRPHFILPPQPTSPPKHSHPLPEIFSPSRKTQKYVANGLASTVQGWIIEAAQTGFASPGIVWGREREDGVRLKARISSIGRDGVQEVECCPGSVVLVTGETEPGIYNAPRAESVVGEEEGVKVLLAGQRGVRGAGGVKVRVGGVVGVRAPTWDIDVCGEKWAVGVDWVVL
ncbi:hypothetical protein BU25DRAFT_219359 [Macroventuria anomochaeta]|uniref:Uncharacterized protein n=1 Tax=Macroventuria anomochaeta TaxID=301207 RepID=A0ACB6RLH7_9PLEO|nr:uncharacterized protein BU25DRAFT_219359 [Macroventuria anomochaeta]KAF2621953.1 hypothetical protein BU25DRAFT_219359 [Macroventuria anomochaeta]